MNINQWSIYQDKVAWVETNIEYHRITKELINEGIIIYISEINKKPNTLILNPSIHSILFKIKNININFILKSRIKDGQRKNFLILSIYKEAPRVFF